MDGIAFGRYLLKAPIGRGGMAEVWRAHLIGVDDFVRPVVVKRILPHLCDSPEFHRMFVAEARLCARLHHPNVVQVFELSSVGSELYMAMEYVPGLDLAELLERLPPDAALPVGMAVQVVRDVCRALGYAHTAVDPEGRPLCIIHRDVSPSNVMLTFDGHVKLLDFGIAKALRAADERTRTGVLKGKLGYLAPEVAAGDKEVDARSDLFGAGVVLYELLTRERLFKAESDLKTLALVRDCRVEPPSRRRAEISPELDAICLRALARDPGDRFADAEQMAQALAGVSRRLGWDELATAAYLREQGIVRSADEPVDAPVTATRDSGAATPGAPIGSLVETATTTARPIRGTRRARWRWLVPLAAALALGAGWGGYSWLRTPAPSEPAIATPSRPAAPPESKLPPSVTPPPAPAATPTSATRAEPEPEPEPAIRSVEAKPIHETKRRRRRARPTKKPAPDLLRGDIDRHFGP